MSLRLAVNAGFGFTLEGDQLNLSLGTGRQDGVKYKAGLYGIRVTEVSESYTSQTCHACGEVKKSGRKHRGLYACACGRHVHADANGAANIFQNAFQVSPLMERSSGRVARPLVLPIRLGWHTS